MIYWDVVILSLGLQLLIMVINLSFFFRLFMSSTVAVTLFVMMYCATIFALVTTE